MIQTASDYVDQNGLNQLSLKNLAEALSIRTPSLYNHIDSLEQLMLEIAHRGMQSIHHEIFQAIIGQSGETALLTVGQVYFQYVIKHPGVYETIQWASWHSTEETLRLFSNYTSLVQKLLLSFAFASETLTENDSLLEEYTNLFTSFVHGYVTMNLSQALEVSESSISNLLHGIQILLLGMQTKH